MLLLVVVFLLALIALQLAFRHPTSGVDPVTTWREMQKRWSVRIAVVLGFLDSAIPVMKQLSDALPQLSTVQALHSLTSNPTYQEFCALLSFALPFIAQWRQGSLHATQETAPDEKH